METISPCSIQFDKDKGEVTLKFSELSLEPKHRRRLEQFNTVKPKRQKTRKSVPKTLKNRLWDETYGAQAGQGECYVCGDTINSKHFEAGHIIAVANGGATTLSNLRCICSTCNKSIGTDDLEYFKRRYFPNRCESSESESDESEENEDCMDIIEDAKPIADRPCFICSKEAVNTGLSQFRLFPCCGIYVHDHIVGPSKCWKEYLRVATDLLGRRETFLRQTDCPCCLDKKWQVLDYMR